MSTVRLGTTSYVVLGSVAAARTVDVLRPQALRRGHAGPLLGVPALAALRRARPARPRGPAHRGARGGWPPAAHVRDHPGRPAGARRLAPRAGGRPGRAAPPRPAEALLQRARRRRRLPRARPGAGGRPPRDAHPLRMARATLRRPARVRAPHAPPARRVRDGAGLDRLLGRGRRDVTAAPRVYGRLESRRTTRRVVLAAPTPGRPMARRPSAVRALSTQGAGNDAFPTAGADAARTR